ncbi:MAG: hypothetical protein Q8936_15880 [Bacillota bacterium]|nr:hypothetical protein [Bacillota bacterium]
MIDELKKVILAGLGSAAYTYEKATKVLDDMVEKGKLTMDEGKELSQELKRNMQEKAQSIKPLTKEDLVAALNQMNFVTKEDLASINERLTKLEESLK